MKRLVPATVILVIVCAYQTYRVLQLEKQLYRAEYFVQSGLLSVQRTCNVVIEQLRASDVLVSELKDLGDMCFGQHDGGDGDAEKESVQRSRSPREYAKHIEHRLNKRKYLPWRLGESVDREKLPLQYLDGSKIH